MIEKIKKEAEARMGKSIDALKSELTKVRTGRANTALLDHVHVDYYGARTPLNQVANVTVADARTLTVTPWDRGMVSTVEKAILESGLGLNPVTVGQTMRVPLPPLSEERRRELGKVVHKEGEAAKVAIRNIRRDSNTHLKDAVKNKEISEDEEKRAEEAIQKLTDRFIAEVDKLVHAKEQDLLEV
jgi:ribosome recycling factor